MKPTREQFHQFHTNRELPCGHCETEADEVIHRAFMAAALTGLLSHPDINVQAGGISEMAETHANEALDIVQRRRVSR